jgi:hypothetical protein
MKTLIIAVCLAGFPLLTRASWSQPACPVSVEAMVEVSPRGFSLADLLTTDTCPALLRAAARLRVGAAPLIGSARVLEGAEVRSLVQKAAATMPGGTGPPTIMRIPERVTVRRTGPRASCADVARLLLGPPGKTRVAAGLGGTARSDLAPQEITSPELQCGGADRIPQWSVLERTKTAWNPALDTWDVSLRCVHHPDCVPFLVRIRNGDASGETAHDDAIEVRDSRINPPPAFHVALNAARAPGATAMVRRGQTVKLLWDQYGVRLLVPAICLDSGDEGQRVRARIARGGRIVPAIVVNAGELRTAL